jgi:hypothetical protein
MPWEVKRFPDGYYVIKKGTGEKKNKKPYTSEADAAKYLSALYANAGSEAMRGK